MAQGCWSDRWIPVDRHDDQSQAVAFITDRVDDSPPSAERWAVQQVIRQHDRGRCKQCTEAGCPMLAWAHGVLSDGLAAYPSVEQAGYAL